MNFEQPKNQEGPKGQPEVVPYLENYAAAAQDEAHKKSELDAIFQKGDYDNKNHYDHCMKCQKAAWELMQRDTRKYGKPRSADTPAWMLRK